MSDRMREDVAGLIDAFNAAWVRPERWNEGQQNDLSIRLRELWAIDRDRWTVNLLELVRVWLLYGDDDPSWRRSIETFRSNMAAAADALEWQIIETLEG